MLKDRDLSTLQQELDGLGETVPLASTAGDAWAVWGAQPSLVCAPATAEGVAAALASCDRAGAAVIPWGGGTQQRLGSVPERADVVVATRRLNRLLEYEPGDLTITVEAGMRFEELQLVLGQHGQWLPLDPPLLREATVGGVIATNVSGSRRIKEGGPRDLVIGTRVAGVDGMVTRAGGRVVKNVTGYDLNKLHIGALGTLGILVDVTFKVAPRPETERSWVGVFLTAKAAGRTATALLQKPLTPSALDILNHRAAARAGVPVPEGQWALVGRASGFTPAVDRHLAEFEAAARAEGALESQSLDPEAATRMWAGLMQSSAESRWSAEALTCRIALPPTAVGSVCDRLTGVAPEAAVWTHATGAVFYSLTPEELPGCESVADVRALAEQAGGGLVVESRPSSLAGVDVWGRPGAPLALMRALKSQYDPHGILNPGRYVGGI